MKKHIPVALALLALVSAPAVAAETKAKKGKDAAPSAVTARRPFALEDLYRLKGVGEPVISPDGQTIVYTVTTSDIKTAKRRVNLWRVDPDGQNARPLTFGDTRDESPVFSPDGLRLAFISSRSGDPQLWLLPMQGGEPEQQTDFPGGVGGPIWSPDARKLVVKADVYPECGADPACNKNLDEKREKGKIKAHLADDLLYRRWNAWHEGKRTHLLLVELVRPKQPKDLTPGDWDSPAFTVGGSLDYAFSPDGQELAFTSNRDPKVGHSTNSDVYVVWIYGDATVPRPLTAANFAYDGTPRFSPDGAYIAHRTQLFAGYESDRFRIAMADRKGGQRWSVTEAFDNWVTDFRFSNDGNRIYFIGEVKGRTPLHELDLETGKTKVLTEVGTLDGWAISPDEKWAVVSRRRIGSPSELWRLDITKAGIGLERRLTFHNEPVEKEVDIRPAEEISVKGADGKPVQVWIVKPHGFDPKKKYPLILNIHGGPQSQWADAFRGDWQVYPGCGYVVAFPNPHGSTGWGQEYTSAISGDWNGKVMQDVQLVADHLAALPYVDKDRMGAMGWSWGGYATMWLAGHTQRFKALAAMMGLYDLRAFYSSTEELWFPKWDLRGTPWENPTEYRIQSPSEFVEKFKTPTLVITGEKDFRVPYTQSLGFFTDLKSQGVPSRLIVFEKAGHWPAWYEMALYYAAHLDWFHKYLGGAPSPWDPKEMAKLGAVP